LLVAADFFIDFVFALVTKFCRLLIVEFRYPPTPSFWHIFSLHDKLVDFAFLKQNNNRLKERPGFVISLFNGLFNAALDEMKACYAKEMEAFVIQNNPNLRSAEAPDSTSIAEPEVRKKKRG